MISLLPLTQCDAAAVETLLDDAFGTERKQRTAYRLRDGMAYLAPLSFGMMRQNRLIGSIQCWPVRIAGDDGETAALILVGPVAVAPDVQRAGYGQMLMRAMIDAAATAGLPDTPPMIMIGDAEYYGRFGFSANETGGWRLPGVFAAHRLLLRNAGKLPLPAAGIIEPDFADIGFA